MAAAGSSRLRLLFVMRSPVFVRNHEALLRELLERGHQVHVAFEGVKEGVGDQRLLVERLARDDPALTVGDVPVPRGMRQVVQCGLRSLVDYLRYLEPEFDQAVTLRARAHRHISPVLRPLAAAPLLSRVVIRRRLRAFLTAFDRQLGVDPGLQRWLEDRRPDAVLLTPLVHFRSPQPDIVRAARAAALKSALAVFSWDNLTNKGLVHEVPDLSLVWNATQRAEAVELHAMPADRVVAVGASAYDHWFDWSPVTTREAFCAAVGLDLRRPFLLYVCSSEFIAPDEPRFVRLWIEEIRSLQPALADVQVLVRPHPLNRAPWAADPLAGLRGVAVHPPAGADPVDSASRADYFDSIHHAHAVIGLNTTALVESAILHRRTFTVLAPEFRHSQQGTLHFWHLVAERGGPLLAAADLAEHAGHLAAALQHPAHADLDDFVVRFVRPHGLDRRAAPLAADQVEVLARPRVPATDDPVSLLH